VIKELLLGAVIIGIPLLVVVWIAGGFAGLVVTGLLLVCCLIAMSALVGVLSMLSDNYKR